MTGCATKPDLSWLLRLVVITGAGAPGRGHVDVARAALAGGCRAVQVRDKELTDRDFAEVAATIKGLCREAHALFFVNDRVDVAAAVGSDGVHLGVDDLDVASARRLIQAGAIIGFSPESLAQARSAIAAGADYLGVGPVFATPTKGDACEPIGPEGLEAYTKARIAPVIAVGGVTAQNAGEAIRVGACGVAVVSAVATAADMEGATREIVNRVKEAAGGQAPPR